MYNINRQLSLLEQNLNKSINLQANTYYPQNNLLESIYNKANTIAEQQERIDTCVDLATYLQNNKRNY